MTAVEALQPGALVLGFVIVFIVLGRMMGG